MNKAQEDAWRCKSPRSDVGKHDDDIKKYFYRLSVLTQDEWELVGSIHKALEGAP
jgi:hypothetical protein